MDKKTKMQRVIDILKEKGSTDEQIAQFLTDLSKTNFARFYTQAMASFTDDDMRVIERCKEEEVETEIKTRYQLRTGKDPQVEMQKFLDDFGTGFLAEYEKEKAAGAAKPTG